MKSWCLDFVSTYEIYWNVPGDKLDVSELPSRAFDSPAQYAETAALAEDYNSHGMELTPGIDARFERLAEERIAAHPLRYYVWLPLGRVADMWLRPRVENLNIDLDWWVYAHHHAETEFSWAYAGLNALYLLLAMRALPAATILGRAAGVYAAAQRVAVDGGSARDALHAGVLPDAVCVGRNCAFRWMDRCWNRLNKRLG